MAYGLVRARGKHRHIIHVLTEAKMSLNTLAAQIGDLAELDTETKDDLVGSINEVVAKVDAALAFCERIEGTEDLRALFETTLNS